MTAKHNKQMRSTISCLMCLSIKKFLENILHCPPVATGSPLVSGKAVQNL